MSRYLTVQCSAAKCSAEGRVKMHGLEANDLPHGWQVVSSSYVGQQLEFCSLECIITWASSMLKARASTRDWVAKPRAPKTVDRVPAGALL